MKYVSRRWKLAKSYEGVWTRAEDPDRTLRITIACFGDEWRATALEFNCGETVATWTVACKSKLGDVFEAGDAAAKEFLQGGIVRGIADRSIT